jgi:porin
MGLRSPAAESGITFDADQTLFYVGNVSGGLERVFEFAGHGDYTLLFDGGKAGVQEGFLFKVHAEHRYGNSIDEATGAFFPSTVPTFLPEPESEHVYVTDFLLTQFLSEDFAVYAGKLNTLDGDMNAFAHGRGKTQFSNFALVNTSVALRTVPYSTLGAGFMIVQDEEPVFQFGVLNATDTVDSAGFEELFDEGAVLTSEMRLPVAVGELPGHQVLGGSWSSRDVDSLGQDPRVILPDIPIARADDSWSLYYNFDQYLVTDSHDPKRGWGLFGRAGVADKHTNPVASLLSAGIGGSSPLRSRPLDTFGIGWYRHYTSDEIGPLLQLALGSRIGDSQGIEAFYNIAITPWFRFTPDIQVIDPALQRIDASLLVGVRGQVVF